jgi:hypothetical protein
MALPQPVKGGLNMPMELLRRLADMELPLALYAPADIDRLRVLRAAQLVEALIPPVETLEGGAQVHKSAQVLCITSKGRQALARETEASG